MKPYIDKINALEAENSELKGMLQGNVLVPVALASDLLKTRKQAETALRARAQLARGPYESGTTWSEAADFVRRLPQPNVALTKALPLPKSTEPLALSFPACDASAPDLLRERDEYLTDMREAQADTKTANNRCIKALCERDTLAADLAAAREEVAQLRDALAVQLAGVEAQCEYLNDGGNVAEIVETLADLGAAARAALAVKP